LDDTGQPRIQVHHTNIRILGRSFKKIRQSAGVGGIRECVRHTPHRCSDQQQHLLCPRRAITLHQPRGRGGPDCADWRTAARGAHRGPVLVRPLPGHQRVPDLQPGCRVAVRPGRGVQVHAH